MGFRKPGHESMGLPSEFWSGCEGWERRRAEANRAWSWWNEGGQSRLAMPALTGEMHRSRNLLGLSICSMRTMLHFQVFLQVTSLLSKTQYFPNFCNSLDPAYPPLPQQVIPQLYNSSLLPKFFLFFLTLFSSFLLVPVSLFSFCNFGKGIDIHWDFTLPVAGLILCIPIFLLVFLSKLTL